MRMGALGVPGVGKGARSSAAAGGAAGPGGPGVAGAATATVPEAKASSSGCPFARLAGSRAASAAPGAPARPRRDPSEGVVPGRPTARGQLRTLGALAAGGLPAVTLHLAAEEAATDGSDFPCWRFPNAARNFGPEYMGGVAGATGWVFPSDPADVQWVAQEQAPNYKERFLPDAYEFVAGGKGLLASSGEYNQRHRVKCTQPFSQKGQLRKFSDVAARGSADMAREWRSAGGETVEVDCCLHMQRLTLDLIGRVAFSYDFGQTQATGREIRGEAKKTPSSLVDAVNDFGESMARVFITPMPVLQALERVGWKGVKNLKSSWGEMKGAMRPIIEKRREDVALAPPEQPRDLLDSLLLTTDWGDDELLEDVVDVLGAGHETTASTLSAALWSVAAHPDVQAEMREELDAVLGREANLSADPAAITWEQLQELHCTKRVIRETLRLYPAIPVFPRYARKDDVLPSGHAVEKGDVVFLSAYALGRNPALWDDPLSFRPDRFRPEAEESRHPFSFLPFGAGPRMCIGAQFAEMSATLALASLLRGNNIEILGDRDGGILPVAYDITMHFHRKGGVKARVSPRVT